MTNERKSVRAGREEVTEIGSKMNGAKKKRGKKSIFSPKRIGLLKIMFCANK